MCKSFPLNLLKGQYKKKHRRFINKAIEKANQSPMYHKHGAVIVHRGKIIASGYNSLQEHKTYSYSIHAEIATLKDFLKRNKNIDILPECYIYVVRIGKESMDFPTKMSKPCSNCYNSVKKYGLKKIYWSTNENINYQLNLAIDFRLN